jgi:hypothetical protein
MRCKGHVVFTGDITNAYRISAGKFNRKIKLGTFTRRWEHNIKMDRNEVVCEDLDWIQLAQNRV